MPKSLRNEIGEACCLYGNGALAPPVTEDHRPQYRADGYSSAHNDTEALRRKLAAAVGNMQARFAVARSGASFTPKTRSPCWRTSGFRMRWRADSCTRRSAVIRPLERRIALGEPPNGGDRSAGYDARSPHLTKIKSGCAGYASARPRFERPATRRDRHAGPPSLPRKGREPRRAARARRPRPIRAQPRDPPRC